MTNEYPSTELHTNELYGGIPLGDVERCLHDAQQGCPEALGTFYEHCRRYLLLIANQELDTQLRAKLGPSDIVQETLLKAQRFVNRFEGRTEAELKAWLRMILLNCVRDTSRRFQAGSKRDLARERELHAVLSDQASAKQFAGGETPSKQVVAQEQTAALRVALGRLSEDYRRVVILRSIERRAFDEIGLAMGRSSDAARKLWLRAVEELRQRLGAKNDSR